VTRPIYKNYWRDIFRIRENIGKSPEAWGILLFNLLILGLVFFTDSGRYSVIAIYFLETLFFGIFNVLKMIIVALFGPKNDRKPDSPPDLINDKATSPKKLTNSFLIIFFILHFSIFYFVQLFLIMSVGGRMDNGFQASDSFIPNPLEFFRADLGDQFLIVTLSIVAMQLFYLIYGFLIKGEYKVTNCLVQGMRPYGRIFVQQFVVLIGGFFIIIFNSVGVFSVVLILIKTLIDLYSQKRHEDGRTVGG
jgi:hypothetical protein